MHTNGFMALAIGLIVVNQVAARSSGLRSRIGFFWGLQVINVGLAVYLFVAGVPGISGQYAGMAGIILGLLFLFRAAQNMLIVLETEREAKTLAMGHMKREISFYEIQENSRAAEAAEAAEAAAAQKAALAANPDEVTTLEGASTDPAGQRH